MNNYRTEGKPISDIFKKPDIALVAFHIGDDEVLGRLKGNLGLLERVPKYPYEFHYLDIVEVDGPIGVRTFIDSEIPIYEARTLNTPSVYSTYEFEAVVPTQKDWFDLVNLFNSYGLRTEFPYNERDTMMYFRKGLCAATAIQEVVSVLEIYVASGLNRSVRKIKNVSETASEKVDSIREENATLIVKRSNREIPFIMLICGVLPIALFTSVTIKTGLHSVIELLVFCLLVLIFAGISVYLYLHNQKYTLILNEDGITADYAISRQRKIKWKDLNALKSDATNSGLILRSQDTEIKLEKNLKEYRLFCLIVSKRTGKDMLGPRK